MNNGESRMLTQAKREEALKDFLFGQGRIAFGDKVKEADKSALTQSFIRVLLADEHLCGKALNLRAVFVLHAGGEELPPQNDGAVHLNMAANLAEQLKHGLEGCRQAYECERERAENEKAENDPNMPLSAKPDSLTGHQLLIGSGLLNAGEKPNTPGNRSPYNIHAETLHAGIAHTSGDLARNARMRAGENRWLWEKEYKYLLSEEALATKPPHRWFRDMCVHCGVSTNTLELITRIDQKQWSELQIGTPNKKSPEKFFLALSLVLESPLTVGGGLVGTFNLPKGSMFGLDTISDIQPDGTINVRVDPKQLDHISRHLYNKPFVSGHSAAEQNLKCLLHLSDAYMHGCIPAQELREPKFLSELLNPVLKHGDKSTLSEDEKRKLSIYLCKKDGNISVLVKEIEEINRNTFHISDAVFHRYTHALECLPKRATQAVSAPLSPEEAFLFARHHHEGNIPSFLSAYRKARGEVLQEVGSRAGIKKERARQLESPDNISEDAARRRALDETIPYSKRIWQLPVDKEGRIQPYVRRYLEDFPSKPPEPPKTHWLTVRETLEEVAGLAEEDKAYAPLLQTLNHAIDMQCQKTDAGMPYQLITLPDGAEVLVKQQEAQPPRLLDHEIRDWVLKHARPGAAVSDVTLTAMPSRAQEH